MQYDDPVPRVPPEPWVGRGRRSRPAVRVPCRQVAGRTEPPHRVDLDHNRDAILVGVLLTFRLDDRL